MKLTRWKLLIGALGLSIGGIAAAAGDPNSVGVVSCAPTDKHTEKHTAFRTTESKPLPPMKVAPVVEIAALAPPTDIPTLPSPPTIPLPVERPSAPALPAIPPPAPPVVPAIPETKPAEVSPPKIEGLKLPTPIDPVKPVELPLPETKALPLTPIAPPPAETPKPIPVPSPRPDFKPLPVPPAPAAELPKPVEALKPVPVEPIPKAIPATPIPAPAAAPAVEATPASRPSTITPSAMKPGEKKLKAILYLGDERPRFEVRDGDEIYLKVVSDRVDVKSPGEGVSTSTLRSMGRVTFVTPGGEGTCDDLAVLPGTGQVVVTGTVRFTYNWGRVETTVSGEKMTFRLGSATVEPTNAGVTPIGFTTK